MPHRLNCPVVRDANHFPVILLWYHLQSIHPIPPLFFCHPVSNATHSFVAVVVIFAVVVIVVVIVGVIVVLVVVEDRHGPAGILQESLGICTGFSFF